MAALTRVKLGGAVTVGGDCEEMSFSCFECFQMFDVQQVEPACNTRGRHRADLDLGVVTGADLGVSQEEAGRDADDEEPGKPP